MNENTKLEIAVEVMAAKIAKTARERIGPEDEKMKQLLKEKIEMYQGNQEIFSVRINVYGKELK